MAASLLCREWRLLWRGGCCGCGAVDVGDFVFQGGRRGKNPVHEGLLTKDTLRQLGLVS